MLPPLAQNTSTTPISEPPATTPDATGNVNSSASFGFRLWIASSSWRRSPVLLVYNLRRTPVLVDHVGGAPGRQNRALLPGAECGGQKKQGFVAHPRIVVQNLYRIVVQVSRIPKHTARGFRSAAR
jgi:hypothetical protein